MAAVQEPEIQLAQRLASNEKPIRTKAMKKLRKYISARSQRAAGGFTGDELLKLWKGLFYCLWMQDKPLLQEELSNQISALIHNFHDIDKQLMYLESFLQTLKREWTGIDRLRMDKFYQLVRFMFRQSFDALRRRSWDSSLVCKFLELLKCNLLQNDSEVPSGLLLHILDLYMTELAAIGAAELTADQNLTFIEPFCRKAAKTKNHALFSAICKSFFSTIIDQAPFAVEDLMNEVKTAEDSDSGQESEEESDMREEDDRRKAVGRNLKTEDQSDDELLHLEDSDTELPDKDIGPVLQFDYAALADKLFELASRSTTPGHNRHKLYRIIKVLRDLSEGIFPQDEYPEEVSTDEDDEMFGSRKRMKRPAHKDADDDEEEGKPGGKKSKADSGKQREAINRQGNNKEPVDVPVNNDKMKKKKKKKKKKAENHEGNTDPKSPGCSEDSVKQILCSNSEPPSEPQLQPSNGIQPEPCGNDNKHQLKKKGQIGDSEPVVPERGEPQLTSASPDTSSETPASLSGKKKQKKQKAEVEMEIITVSSEASGEECPEGIAPTPGKKKQHQKTAAKVVCDLSGNATSITEVKCAGCDDASGDDLTPKLKKIPDTATLAKKKIKKIEEEQQVVADTSGEIQSGLQHKKITKKKAKQEVNADQNTIDQSVSESLPVEEHSPTPVKRKKKQKGKKMTDMSESPQTNAGNMQQMQKNGKSLMLATDQLNEVGDSNANLEQPLVEAGVVRSVEKVAKRKKRKIPVEFEFEADGLEGATAVSSIKETKKVIKKTKLNNDVGEQSTPQSLNKSNKSTSRLSGSDFISFQRKPAVPTPLYCKTNGSPTTPASSKNRQLTPKSESKKVTFGLKNNKTAEFKKTDRSVLLSPEGLARVPFDPQQKPKFGVLKSPPATVSTGSKKTPKSTKKTPNISKKTGTKSLPNTPKRRPLAADFF